MDCAESYQKVYQRETRNLDGYFYGVVSAEKCEHFKLNIWRQLKIVLVAASPDSSDAIEVFRDIKLSISPVSIQSEQSQSVFCETRR